jgi:hypothetical protein
MYTSPLNRRPWRPSDGDMRCQKCGAMNPIWWVDDEVWNVIADTREDILCPNCFMHLADSKGYGGIWRLHTD